MPNKINQPFILLSLAILFLLVSYFFIGDKEWLGYKFKAVNLIADLTTKKSLKNNSTNFSLATQKPLISKTDTAPPKRNNTVTVSNDNINDTSTFLNHFFEAISKVVSGNKVRVAYFGDSMIEGDLLTQDLRYFFQRDFGGHGVGFVPITSPVAGFRRTIANNASKNWEVFNLINADTSYLHGPGISGYSFIPTLAPVTIDTMLTDNSSWAKFSATKSYSTLKEFYNVSLYYGRSLNVNTRLSYTFGGKTQFNILNGNQSVNELVLNKLTPKQYLTMNMICNQPLPIYGLNFDSDTGVFVDNFAFRGNSGLALTKIPHKVLKDFNKYLKYDLIVLQYGLNVANAKMTNYSWYEAGMVRVINYFKSCFPQASFLVVSVGDKSWNNNGVFETDPSIPILVEAQKHIAEKTGAAFFNFYQAMGGYNSMVNWVEGDTVYANKDYTHLNHKGAARVANYLYHYLMNGYKQYQKSNHQLTKNYSSVKHSSNYSFAGL